MLHATYYVVAHIHLVMGVAAVFGIFAGTYFWFPKMFGRAMSEPLGKLHFWLTFAGAYCIFMPMPLSWASPVGDPALRGRQRRQVAARASAAAPSSSPWQRSSPPRRS